VSGSGRSIGGSPGISAVVDAFTAVVTTGIYCQPACSARPRAANTHTFPFAAAAEGAGYRACLRCRPYRYPQTVGWDAPELVCRAVRLILDGALDQGNEDELARRLGISARHLRRLFALHLGVTPDGLARSARVHFARRLLDDTDLSVTEVAFAAGFGSLRQFNRACRDVFCEAPRALRSRRRKADRLVADGGLPLRLAFLGELDWTATLGYLAEHAIPGVERVERGMYRRTIVVDGYPGVLELRRGSDDYLVLCAHLPRWRELVHIVQRARRIANLDLPLAEAEHVLSRDPHMRRLLRARPGLRPPGAWDAFEAAVYSILAEHATPTHAGRMAGRVTRRFGEHVPGLERLGLGYTFPTPETLAGADLRVVGLGRARAGAIRSFAEAVTADAVRLDRSMSLERLVESITAVEGVGPRVAQLIAYRLGEPDAFPAAVLALPEDAEDWRPWRAVAFAHLSQAEEQYRSDLRVRGAA
jgi:AraC family transcriptional regulator, regulatory protein of adaptative response / DNA-3-methyladenine glycosylase II